jgi:hypothetical protein
MTMDTGRKMKSILDKTEISLVLDTYDDIFSDFDPRPYNERALSEDFLAAAKRAARDRGEGVELRFLIPKSVRNPAHEELIRQRLNEYFKRHYRMLKKEYANYRKNAMLLVFAGVVIGVIDAIVLSTLNLNTILADVVGIILTPASWYSVWTGFDHLIARPKEDAAEEAFYRKLRDTQISFAPY